MRKTRCGRCHRARLVYKVEGVLGWAELCHACREELRLAALSDARDELVRAAVALNAAHSDIALAAPVDPTSAVVSRRLAWSDFRAAAAAYEKLAGGA